MQYEPPPPLSEDEAERLAAEHWAQIASTRARQMQGVTQPRQPYWSETGEGSSIGDTIYFGLDELRDLLFDLAYRDGQATADARTLFDETLSELMRAVYEERQRQRMAAATRGLPVTFQEIVRRTVRRLREASELTQQQFADHMGRAGFVNWKRITVAEVESGKRQLSTEEMVAVALLFDIPVCYLLTSFDPGEELVVNERLHLTPAQAQEVVADADIEKTWQGVRLSPTYTGGVVIEEGGDYWRPASNDGDGALWSKTTEGENGEMILRGPYGYTLP